MQQLLQFKYLSIQIEKSESEVTYIFKGGVDENFKHQEIPRIAAKNITFDLGEIDNFNSCGIREWVHFMKDMDTLGPIKFKNCSITMIDQINLVPDTLGHATITSFQAPYYCPTCPTGGELVCSIDVQQHLSSIQKKTSPQFDCPKCQQKLEFDALEESYFMFAEELN